MAKNPIATGDLLQFTAPSGGVTVGIPILVGLLLCIPVTSAAEGEIVNAYTKGHCVDLPKATGESFAQGDLLYWDDSETKLTKTATGNSFAGIAVSTEGSGATTCDMLLTPNVRPATATEAASALAAAVAGAVTDTGTVGNAGKLVKLDVSGKLDGYDVNAEFAKIGGALSTLTTTDKTSLIAAINELVTRVAALESP